MIAVFAGFDLVAANRVASKAVRSDCLTLNPE